MSAYTDALNVLGVTDEATKAEVKAAYKALAQDAHPDKGGDVAAFQRLAASYGLVMAQAPEARACGECKGAGERTVRRGFFTVKVPCRPCGGTGEERQA